jgi:hypothetical protein
MSFFFPVKFQYSNTEFPPDCPKTFFPSGNFSIFTVTTDAAFSPNTPKIHTSLNGYVSRG